jgi:hypothetical protein
MNFMKCLAGAVLLVSMSAPSLAADERNIYVAVKAGGGSINVNAEHAINGIVGEEDIFSGGVFAGYNFDSGLVIEGGLSVEFSEDIFDSYDVSEIIGMLGYTFHPAKDFTVTPKAGFSMWELVTFESGLFNFFQEDEELTYDGTDLLFALEGEYSWTPLVQINLSYTQGSYDFGDLDSFRLGVEFDF